MAMISSGGGKKAKKKAAKRPSINRGTAQAFQRSRQRSPAGEPSDQMGMAVFPDAYPKKSTGEKKKPRTKLRVRKPPVPAKPKKRTVTKTKVTRTPR